MPLRVATATVLACCALRAFGQAVEGEIKATDPPPPLTFRGLIPGLSTAAEVREKLGAPASEAKWYAWKMLYPSSGRDGLLDSVHLHAQEGRFACVEAASVPEGYETADAVRAKLGQPEFELLMATFTLLDYSAQGVRFIVNREGRTIGVAQFPHLRPRVYAGARRRVDLSALRQGPQPAPAEAAALNGLLAGGAAVKITPQREWLDPKHRESFQPHDDLWARVAVFRQGPITLALVGADLFGMNRVDILPMIEKARAAGASHFILAMSHNHAAPDTIGVYGHFPAEYVAMLQTEVGHGVEQAIAALRPVKTLRTASRELPMDGARVIGLIRNARNPGLVDPTISLIQAIGDDDKPIVSLVNFACHVEGLDKGVSELSADFPGYMCDQLQRQGFGQVVFLNGAVGGMISGDSRARTHEEAQVTGLAFASIVQELAVTAQPPASFSFTAETRQVQIPMTNERFKPLYEARRPLYRGRVITEMSYFTLGECQFITIPGELLPEVAVEILEKMTGFPRVLVGLANDELGYIIPAEDFRDDEYEETMSQGPATAPVIRDTALRMLQGER